MAFRTHKPNVRSPFVSDDNTWSNAAPEGKTKKVLADTSKENAASALAPSSSTDLSTLIKDMKRPVNSEVGVWSGAKSGMVQRPVKEDASINTILSGLRDLPPGESANAFDLPTDKNNIRNATVPRTSKTKSKNATWKTTSNLNQSFLQNNENNIVVSGCTKTKNDNEKENSNAVFSLETLSTALHNNDSVTAPYKSQHLDAFTQHASSAFTKCGGYDKMDYRAAARNNMSVGNTLPKKALGFPIYTDFPVSSNDLSMQSKTAPPKLQDCARKLQRLSDKNEPGAAEEAEALLRNMLVRYKAENDFPRPDGSCYNQYVSFSRCVKTECCPRNIIISITFYSHKQRDPRLRQGRSSREGRDCIVPHV